MSNADERQEGEKFHSCVCVYCRCFNLLRPVIIFSDGHNNSVLRPPQVSFYDLHTEFTELCDTMPFNGNQACKTDKLNLDQ